MKLFDELYESYITEVEDITKLRLTKRQWLGFDDKGDGPTISFDKIELPETRKEFDDFKDDLGNRKKSAWSDKESDEEYENVMVELEAMWSVGTAFFGLSEMMAALRGDFGFDGGAGNPGNNSSVDINSKFGILYFINNYEDDYGGGNTVKNSPLILNKAKQTYAELNSLEDSRYTNSYRPAQRYRKAIDTGIKSILQIWSEKELT